MNKIVPGKYKCSHCKKYLARGKVVKSSKQVRKGKEYQYYVCVKCNSDRMRAYLKTDNGRRIVNRAVAKSMKLHATRQAARAKVNYHIAKGKIVRPKICPKCNKRKKTEAHHTDYTKPLKVKFMCRQCHAVIHRKLEDKSSK